MNHPFAKKVAGLPDDVFHRHSDGNTEDERVGSLAMEAVSLGFRGLILGAPQRVELDDSPLWTFIVTAGLPRADAPFVRNATLIAVSLDRGDVLAARAIPPNPTKHGAEDVEDLPLPPPPPPPPPQLVALGEGMSAGLVWFDVVDVLSIPRSAGRWALRLLSFDELSNEVLVEATSRHPAIGAQGAPAKPHPLLSATPSQRAPALASVGAALALEGKAAAEHLVLHGAMRVEPASYMFTGSSATVKATILLLAKNHSSPVQVPIAISLSPRESSQRNELIDVGFSIDVGDVMPKRPVGPWRAYLVAGRHISAPLPLDF